MKVGSVVKTGNHFFLLVRKGQWRQLKSTGLGGSVYSDDDLNEIGESTLVFQIDPSENIDLEFLKQAYTKAKGLTESLTKEPADTDLVVCHDPAEGTTIKGDTRTWKEAIKALSYPRFVWSPSRSAYYVQRSADSDSPAGNLERIAGELRKAGATVRVERGTGQRRSFAEQMEAYGERAEAREERYAERAEKVQAKAQGALNKAMGILEHHTGEPIKVGHHSEGRHRRDLERHDAAMRQSIELEDKAAYYAGRAAGTRKKEDLEDPSLTIRRIERLEADQRSRARNGMDTTEIDEQIAYWKDSLKHRSKRPYGPGDFKPGRSYGGNAILKVGDKSITLAVRQMHYASTPPIADTHPYTKMGSTDKPEQEPWEPEAKGKHPRGPLIEAIYKHPLTPDAWKVRVGWKHAIAYEPYGFGKGTRLLILEDLPDGELDQLAQERGIPVSGKIAKAEKHPHLALIKAIYKETSSGFRKQEGGKHYIRENAYAMTCLEDVPTEELARKAFYKRIDPSVYGVPTGWTRAEQINALASMYSGSMPIDGVPVDVDDAIQIRLMMNKATMFDGTHAVKWEYTPIPEIVNWVNKTPIEQVLRVTSAYRKLWYGAGYRKDNLTSFREALESQ